MIDSAAEIAQLRATVEQLQTALDNRPRIEHAVGMLMLLMSCSQDVAVFTLKRVSQHINRKLLEVADLITASVSTGTPLPADVGGAPALVLPPRQSSAPLPRRGEPLAASLSDHLDARDDWRHAGEDRDTSHRPRERATAGRKLGEEIADRDV